MPDFDSKLQFAPSQLDNFGRLRVSQPETLFDSKMLHDNAPLLWDDSQTSGAGTSSTYNANQSSVTLAVTAATAGTRVRQTFRRFNYQPGKSQLTMMTTVFGAAVAGITKRVGLFDDNNGLFYEMAPTGMQLIVRTSTSGAPVDTAITQANWNIDKMDGTGVSGVTLDFTKSQILFFDFSWLGVGISRYGWVVDGKTFYCHEVRNTNNLALVYMSMPNLPFRYEISNSGAGGAASLLHICTTIISEGGVQANGFSFGLTRGSTPIITNNNASIYPLISLRLKSTHIGSTVRVKNISIACSSTSTYVWYLILNPTVVGTALAWTGVTNSSIEANLVSTNATTLTGGTILASGVSQQTNDGGVNIMSPNDHALGSSISGTRDIIVLAVQRVTGTSETFYGSLNIKDEN